MTSVLHSLNTLGAIVMAAAPLAIAGFVAFG